MLSIQDMGRDGYAAYAVPQGGVMDRNSASLAHTILGQSIRLPIIEVTMFAPKIEFSSEANICLTGADFNWKLNGNPISLTSVTKVVSGDLLSGGVSKEGSRGYLAIEGMIDAQNHIGSASTYPLAGLGGVHGQYLGKGDVIEWYDVETSVSTQRLKRTKLKTTFTLHPGPEYNQLTEESKHTFTSSNFKIAQDSDRMGIRLEGPPLTCIPNKLSNSVPVVPGIIQLPPSGQPIILLRDGQTTGGYPRVGYIAEVDHDSLGQLSIGEEIQFDHEV